MKVKRTKVHAWLVYWPSSHLCTLDSTEDKFSSCTSLYPATFPSDSVTISFLEQWEVLSSAISSFIFFLEALDGCSSSLSESGTAPNSANCTWEVTELDWAISLSCEAVTSADFAYRGTPVNPFPLLDFLKRLLCFLPLIIDKKCSCLPLVALKLGFRRS